MHASALPHLAIYVVVRRKNVFAWALLLRVMVCQLRNDQPFFAHAASRRCYPITAGTRPWYCQVDGPANAKCESFALPAPPPHQSSWPHPPAVAGVRAHISPLEPHRISARPEAKCASPRELCETERRDCLGVPRGARIASRVRGEIVQPAELRHLECF